MKKGTERCLFYGFFWPAFDCWATTHKISCCSKAANEDIPSSVVNYVTGVAEHSQRRYGAKDKA